MSTIVAPATPWGRGAVALVRLSGPEARRLAEQLCPGPPPWRPRRASLRRLVAGSLEDEALVTWMPGPRSFTGEDVVELACHGNPVIVQALVAAAVSFGARPARPGEFTRRAVENGRLGLLEAESLASLVAATSAEGVALARQGLQGALSTAVAALRERLLDAAAELEARLDQPEGDLGFEDDEAVIRSLEEIATRARMLASTWQAGRIRIEGARVALIGPVNAGKSSLFNHLVGEERALVSPSPGTTRDAVERTTSLDGLPVTFLDTAGERADPGEIEAAGLVLGRRLGAEADLRLLLIPLDRPLSPESASLLEQPGPCLRVGSFADRPSASGLPAVDVALSNATGQGLDALRRLLRDRLFEAPPAGAQAVLTSARQHALFREVAERAAASAEALAGPAGPAIAAEEATRALEALAELTGDDVREDVLDRLFARFCIGK